MRSERAVGPRLMSIFARVFLDALLPLAVAYMVVSFLADPARLDARDLRANSLLIIGVNVRPGAMSMEEGRSVAVRTAETTWPGSEFVAGVARYSSASHGVDRPERLTYYYRNDSNEVLQISFMDADRLAIEVRKYESEDQIDFTGQKPLPAGMVSYDTPLARAEQTGGADRRRILRSYIVRVIVTWPKDRDGPVYSVKYDGTSGSQGVPVCCFDAKTGALADSLFAPRVEPPWPVPADCAASRTVFRQIDRLQATSPTARACPSARLSTSTTRARTSSTSSGARERRRSKPRSIRRIHQRALRW